MEINGIAHTQITVTNFEKCLPFYKQLFALFEMQEMYVGDNYYYCIGGRTGFGVSACAPEFADETFQQTRIGLHHICFRMRKREDVDVLAARVTEFGGTVVRPPAQQDHWAPGMYSVLFEDPDGIRLEANFIPGKGHLENAGNLEARQWRQNA